VSPEPPGTPVAFSAQRKLRLAYFVTHPIQYQAPLLRRIAQEPDIDLKVFFSSDISVRGYVDPGFGVRVEWDIPLLDGYNSEFLPVLREAQDGKFLAAAGNINRNVGQKLREGQFDAVWVHGYNYITNLQAIRAAKSLRIPVLLRAESTLHDRTRSRAKLAVKKRFFAWLQPHIAAVLSIGKENSAYWKHTLGDSVPQFPFHYAVDNEFFQKKSAEAAETREEFRASLDLDPGRLIILFASKLSQRKRCPDLLEAYLQLARNDDLKPRPYLLIVGDGEQRPQLESRVQQAQASSEIHAKDVHFLGFRNQSELPRFYDLCTIFVLASVDEPWGLSINEVMNAGRPVIVSSQVGCQKDLVHPGVNGCVIPAGNTEPLASALAAILSDPAKAKKMGGASLRIVSAYNFDQNVAGLRQALHATVPGFPIS
jgi:glycosyltransferase involved in cell wall biosynthesis